VVLQHRAAWSHHGDTWGLPGGARNSHESPVEAALREAAEEAGLAPELVWPAGTVTDDHGGWSYTSVVAEPVGQLRPRPTGGESTDVRWVPVDEVGRLPLHPGFAATWPRLRSAPAGLVLVVDGANVVGARGGGDGWWRDRPGAARRLRDALLPLTRAGLPAADLPSSDPAGPDEFDLLLPRVLLVVEGAARVIAADPPAALPAPAGPPAGPANPPAGPTSLTAGPAGSTAGPASTAAEPAGSSARPAGPTAGPGSPVGALAVLAAPGSGDDRIVAVAAAEAAAGHRVLAVTADRGLTARLAAIGIGRVGPRWLIDRIDHRPDSRR
jgi:ADP-ribose pyrophosphatase YjhB (NUDIX family)